MSQLKTKVLKLAYTAEDVKRLREQTAAGMLDCKKALDEADGDYQKR